MDNVLTKGGNHLKEFEIDHEGSYIFHKQNYYLKKYYRYLIHCQLQKEN